MKLYLEYTELNKAESTHRNDEYRIKANLVPYFGRMLISEIEASHVERYKQKRLREDVTRNTINHELSTMNHDLSAMNYLTLDHQLLLLLSHLDPLRDIIQNTLDTYSQYIDFHRLTNVTIKHGVGSLMYRNLKDMKGVPADFQSLHT